MTRMSPCFSDRDSRFSSNTCTLKPSSRGTRCERFVLPGSSVVVEMAVVDHDDGTPFGLHRGIHNGVEVRIHYLLRVGNAGMAVRMTIAIPCRSIASTSPSKPPRVDSEPS